ncbi:hypothetical protein BGZ65_004256, partial [Modicella reniformis]
MFTTRRQRAALPEPAKELINRITGFQPGDNYFDTCSTYVAFHLFDVNGLGGNRNKSISHDMINKRLNGLAEKLFIRGQDTKSDALEGYLKRLRGMARSLGGGDGARMIAAISEMNLEEAAQNVLSSVLLILLELEQKKVLKSQQELDRELLRDILKEDPLVGDHWIIPAGGDEQETDESDSESKEMNQQRTPEAEDVEQGSNFNNDSTGKSEAALWRQLLRERSRALEPLRALERWQYWRGNSVKSKGTTEFRRSDAGYNIQCSTELNAALRNLSGFILPFSTPIMDELDIINEIFLLLQGLPTVIFTLKDSVAKYSTEVVVTHLSQGALRAIIQPFLGSAGEIAQLQAALDNIYSASAKPQGKIIQAFMSALHSEFVEFKVFLTDKQCLYRRYTKGHEQRMASLVELQAILSEKLNIVHSLLSFLKNRKFYGSTSNSRELACSYGIDILSSLFKNVCEFELSGDSDNTELFLRLLRQSIRPFLLNLECWLSGQPLDSESEFLVQTALDTDIFSNAYWSTGCYLQTEIVDEGEGDNNYTPSIGFKWRMECGMAKAIEEQYISTNVVLKSLLSTQSRLLWHLKGMTEFYFMMQGEVMHSFSTRIFRKILRKRPWCDSYVLGSTFNQVATLCEWSHSKFIKVRTSDRAGQKATNMGLSGMDIQVMSRIWFEYLLPWPLAGIIYSSENAKQMYSRITCLLLQVKTSKHAMEQSLFLKWKPKPNPDLKLFWKLRMRFLSTMNDLWSYFMTT